MMHGLMNNYTFSNKWMEFSVKDFSECTAFLTKVTEKNIDKE